MYECLFAYMSVHCMHAIANKGQKRAKDPLDLELPIGRCELPGVDTGNTESSKD